MEKYTIGPVLGEEAFFTMLDTRIDALKAAETAYLQGSKEKARHLFAEYVRSICDADTFFNLGGKPYAPVVSAGQRKEAENAMRNLLSSCGTPFQFGEEIDWYANPTYNEYKEWTWQLTRHPFIKALAMMYCETGDEKYAEKAVWYMLSWIRQAVRPDDGTSPYATLCWRTIECGLRLQCWTDVLHMLMHSSALTDDAICLIFRSNWETSHRLRIDHAKGTNWLVMEMTGLAKFSMTFPVFRESEEFLSYALEKLNETFYLQMHPDGFQYELSTCYHRVVVDQCLVVANLVERYGRRMEQRFYDTIEKSLELYIRLCGSGFIVPDLSDGDYGDIRIFIKKHDKLYPDNQNIRYAMSHGNEGEMQIPTFDVLKNSGIVMARDTWENAGRVSLLFDAGKFGSNHQHEDKLNLLISAFGKPIVVESNRYAYDTSDIRRYVLASASHNTVLVDGMGQNRRKNFKWQHEMLESEEVIPTYSSARFDYARGVYDEGYGEEAERLATHTREMIFVKAPECGYPYVIAVDTMTAEEEHTFESIWHYDISDDLKIDGNIITCADMTTILLGEVGTLSVVKGQEEPFVQGIICRSTKQGDYEGIPTLLRDNRGKNVRIATIFAPTNGEECVISDAIFDGNMLTIVYKNGKSNTFAIDEIAKLAK
ncbi:MAG: alginate lyase family protein [Clostridia bacterium]|nr:alginate lyase family protein [Clostridia bacterium]